MHICNIRVDLSRIFLLARSCLASRTLLGSTALVVLPLLCMPRMPLAPNIMLRSVMGIPQDVVHVAVPFSALQLPGVNSQDCEFCMFGKPWRKSTRFMYSHLGLATLDCYRCIHKPRGLCKRTMMPHIELSGKDPNATHQFLTYSAQAYPRGLCKVLAEAFHNAAIISKLESLHKLLG